MKFIKSNWKGYEIDSSEFFAEIQTENPCMTIQSFLNSPYIDSKFNCFNLVSRLISTYKIAESEDADLVNSLKNDVLTISEIIDKYKKINDSALSKENLIEICQFVQIIIKNFPHLVYEFNESLIRFKRKGAEESNNFEMTIVGIPVTFVVSWYESEEWEAVLKSLRWEGKFSFNSWL